MIEAAIAKRGCCLETLGIVFDEPPLQMPHDVLMPYRLLLLLQYNLQQCKGKFSKGKQQTTNAKQCINSQARTTTRSGL